MASSAGSLWISISARRQCCIQPYDVGLSIAVGWFGSIYRWIEGMGDPSTCKRIGRNEQTEIDTGVGSRYPIPYLTPF